LSYARNQLKTMVRHGGAVVEPIRIIRHILRLLDTQRQANPYFRQPAKHGGKTVWRKPAFHAQG